jgi:cytochrome c peroxidase
MARWALPALVAAICALAVLWWDHAGLQLQAPALAAPPPAPARPDEPVQPLPRSVDLDPARVALGARLFRDPRLSRDQSLSCATCHATELGGADGRRRSVGIDGAVGHINTPTVFNSGFAFRQFWDGRARSLEDQIDGPLKSPDEMGSSWELVIERIESDPSYREAFRASYADGIQEANVKDAIATFERSLVTPDSRFDQFLRGADALSPDEQQGYALFKHYGCVGCHQGMLLGGNMFQRLGIVRDYFRDRGDVEPADFGRYNVTGDEADRYVFKVPSLRNVALTAPYFHDGSAATLPEAIRVMARYQLGREIPEPEVQRIAAFLATLSGELRSPL